jgi:hypothetical protein
LTTISVLNIRETDDENREGPRNFGFPPFNHLKRLLAQESFIRSIIVDHYRALKTKIFFKNTKPLIMNHRYEKCWENVQIDKEKE